MLAVAETGISVVFCNRNWEENTLQTQNLAFSKSEQHIKKTLEAYKVRTEFQWEESEMYQEY